MANVLVIGSGAREHAIAATMLKSPQVTTVYCAPGNPGMKKDQIQIVDIDEMDFPKLVEFAKEHLIDLTFVGPEVPLSKGIVDAFIAARLRVFGPDESAARLESDKNLPKASCSEIIFRQPSSKRLRIFRQPSITLMNCHYH